MAIGICALTQQKKSIHIPFRSKYNRVTKRARYLHENPSCLLCNILHRYLQQADYSVIEEATMVSLYACRTHGCTCIRFSYTTALLNSSLATVKSEITSPY